MWMKKVKKENEFHIKHWKGILLIIEILSLSLGLLGLFLNPLILKVLMGKQQNFSIPTILFMYKFEAVLFFSGLLLWLFKRFYLKDCQKRVKEITLNILISAFLLVFIMLMLEIGVRVFMPQKTSVSLVSFSAPIFREGEYISWEFIPNATGMTMTGEYNISYKINSFGMRDVERNVTKTPRVKRILVLGDSFTEGFGVEQNYTYPHLLEDMLRNKGEKIEVWNAGVRGYSPGTEYLYLKNNIDWIKPDMVIVGFFSGNDVMDISHNIWKTDKDGFPIYISSRLTHVENGMLVITNDKNNPYLCTTKCYINTLLFTLSHLYSLINKNLKASQAGDVEILPLLSKNPSKEVQYDYNMTKILLSKIKEMTESRNASFMMVIIPSRIQVNDKEWDYTQKKFKDYNAERDLVQKEMMDWCRYSDAKCIDLLPYFRQSKEQLFHIITDSHLNEGGNIMAARGISEEIG